LQLLVPSVPVGMSTALAAALRPGKTGERDKAKLVQDAIAFFRLAHGDKSH